MLRLRPSNFPRPILVACLLFSVRCFAQFEVAPDHFDGDESQTVRSSRGNDKANAPKTTARVRAPQPAAKRVLTLKLQMAEQQAVLAPYLGEVLTIYQRELDKLQNVLATVVRATEVTLARVQAELDSRSQLATNLHLGRVTSTSLQTLH
jgi:hypothetical protein